MTYSPNNGVVSQRLQAEYQSGTGVEMCKATPVSIDSDGNVIEVDVSSEDSVYRIVGLVSCNMGGGNRGNIVDTGRIEEVSIGYSVGDALYVSKAGFLTNIKPDVGVGGFASGDWVVFVGLVVKNQKRPGLKDIQLMLSVVGQL